jgi:hypothetical protein
MNGEAAIAGLPILADDLLALWQTLGYSYERLTTGIAPGNAARQGFSAHDHGGGGTGVFLCQPLGRWDGTSEMAASGGEATGLPFGAMASFYSCAVACTTYSQQDAVAFIAGQTGSGGINTPEATGPALSVEWDGTALADVMHYQAAGGVWLMVAAIPSALNAAGFHSLALRINAATIPTLAGGGYAIGWNTLMAEVWPVQKVEHGL